MAAPLDVTIPDPVIHLEAVGKKSSKLKTYRVNADGTAIVKINGRYYTAAMRDEHGKAISITDSDHWQQINRYARGILDNKGITNGAVPRCLGHTSIDDKGVHVKSSDLNEDVPHDARLNTMELYRDLDAFVRGYCMGRGAAPPTAKKHKKTKSTDTSPSASPSPKRTRHITPSHSPSSSSRSTSPIRSPRSDGPTIEDLAEQQTRMTGVVHHTLDATQKQLEQATQLNAELLRHLGTSDAEKGDFTAQQMRINAACMERLDQDRAFLTELARKGSDATLKPDVDAIIRNQQETVEAIKQLVTRFAEGTENNNAHFVAQLVRVIEEALQRHQAQQREIPPGNPRSDVERLLEQNATFLSRLVDVLREAQRPPVMGAAGGLPDQAPLQQQAVTGVQFDRALRELSTTLRDTLQRRDEGAEQRVQQVEDRCQRQLEAMEQQMRILTESNRSLNERYAASHDRVLSLLEELVRARDSQSANQETVRHLENTIREHSNNNQVLQRDLNEARRQNTASQDQVANLQAELRQAIERITDQNRTNDELRGRVEALGADNSEEVERLRRIVQEVQAENRTWLERNATLQRQLAEATEQIRELQARLAALQAQLLQDHAGGAENAELQQRIAGLEAEIAELTTGTAIRAKQAVIDSLLNEVCHPGGSKRRISWGDGHPLLDKKIVTAITSALGMDSQRDKLIENHEASAALEKLERSYSELMKRLLQGHDSMPRINEQLQMIERHREALAVAREQIGLPADKRKPKMRGTAGATRAFVASAGRTLREISEASPEA